MRPSVQLNCHISSVAYIHFVTFTRVVKVNQLNRKKDSDLKFVDIQLNVDNFAQYIFSRFLND